eukprot:UN26964
MSLTLRHDFQAAFSFPQKKIWNSFLCNRIKPIFLGYISINQRYTEFMYTEIKRKPMNKGCLRFQTFLG